MVYSEIKWYVARRGLLAPTATVLCVCRSVTFASASWVGALSLQGVSSILQSVIRPRANTSVRWARGREREKKKNASQNMYSWVLLCLFCFKHRGYHDHDQCNSLKGVIELDYHYGLAAVCFSHKPQNDPFSFARKYESDDQLRVHRL